jgi:predicted RNase H-like HicB family nuclease
MKVTAQAQRTGDWWAVEVPEVDGVFTQAKRLDQVPEMVADAVALLEDVDPATVEVEVVPLVPDAIVEALTLAHDCRERAEELTFKASSIIRQTALDLTSLGYSMRDIGFVLRVSHQRVAQLLAPRPMTIKEAGEAATRGPNRPASRKANGAVRVVRSSGNSKSVTKKSRSAAAAAAATLAQSPRKGKAQSAAARALRQSKP